MNFPKKTILEALTALGTVASPTLTNLLSNDLPFPEKGPLTFDYLQWFSPNNNQ